MGASFGEIEHAAIVGRQFCCEPFAIRWRAWSQVEGYIEDRASDTLDELRFRVWFGLIMHSSYRALMPIVRDAALSQVGI